MTISSFHPPERTLMGPGPSDVNPRILEAIGRPTVGHLDPAFVALMDETKSLLKQVFLTENDLTMPISAPGSAGMESAFVNLVEAGDTVIVCQNGVFGGRMKENVIRCGATAIMVEDEWGTAVSLDKLEDALKAHPEASIVAFVHAETSTGVRSDAQAISALAHQHDCLVIADAVTSLAGSELRVDDWQIDAIYSGTQKCLSCVPGLSPVSYSEAATARIKARTTPVQSWFLDLNLVMDYWGEGAKRSYHHTAPVNSIYAFHESLVLVLEEGLENAWARHQKHHDALKAGLEAMGLSLFVDESIRLPQLNAVTVPEGVDEAAVRSSLLQQYNLEIGAGLGPMAGKIWRIGLMGYACNQTNVLTCLSALEGVLAQQGASIQQGHALPAAMKSYA